MPGYSIFNDTICDMTWLEVAEAAKSGAVMLVPLGVIEQHGPHLPLGTDIYGAHLLCSFIKSRLREREIASVIAPPYYFGINRGTGMFPGSINITENSMVAILTDLLVNYKTHGFKRQFLVNHHGDPQHNWAIFRAILNSRQQGVEAASVMRPSTERAYRKGDITLPPSAILKLKDSPETQEARVRLTRSQLHVHAEERETSLIMRWYPALLKKVEEIKTFEPVIPTAEVFDQAESGGKWRELSPQGYIGDPACATAENGELYLYEARDIADAIANHPERGEAER
jgi:creatinine amidohydrolase